MKNRIYIGISGWRYAGWRKHFYPDDLPQKRELEYASHLLPTIEINGSFYALQRASSYRKWYEETPRDFVFSVKGSRFITHTRRLKEVEQPLANFFASGVLLLREKLGPFLWQLPPSLKYNEEVLDHFLSLLPHDTEAASQLGEKHDDRISGERVALDIDQNRPIRHVMEVRHDSFQQESFIRLLRKHRVSLVFSDAAGHWPYAEDVTADVIYIRLHGTEERYVSGYTDSSLDAWAEKIRAWAGGKEPPEARKISSLKPPRRAKREVFVYFDNDVKVKAPEDAQKLMKRLGVSSPGREEFPEEKKAA